jgi:hypothetical protein
VNDIEADFFALGGHSLLAMRLAAQLSRAFAQGDAGAGYGRLDGEQAQRAAGLADATSRRSVWGMKPFCRCAKRRPDAVLFPSGVRFCLAVQRAGALSQPALVDRRHSVAASGRADAAARIWMG